MLTAIRRLVWLVALAGAGYAAWSWLRPRPAPEPTPPQWPPLDVPAPEPTGWVAPDDRTCPASHPIKANDNSGIYHVPGGRFYDRVNPERCYAEPAAAETDGYRRAKS